MSDFQCKQLRIFLTKKKMNFDLKNLYLKKKKTNNMYSKCTGKTLTT